MTRSGRQCAPALLPHGKRLGFGGKSFSLRSLQSYLESPCLAKGPTSNIWKASPQPKLQDLSVKLLVLRGQPYNELLLFAWCEMFPGPMFESISCPS